VTQDLARARLETKEAGAQTKKRRLSGAVGALDKHHFARADLKIYARKGRESADQSDRGVQPNNGHVENAI
jgi:hypothetical protein